MENKGALRKPIPHLTLFVSKQLILIFYSKCKSRLLCACLSGLSRGMLRRSGYMMYVPTLLLTGRLS